MDRLIRRKEEKDQELSEKLLWEESFRGKDHSHRKTGKKKDHTVPAKSVQEEEDDDERDTTESDRWTQRKNKKRFIDVDFSGLPGQYGEPFLSFSEEESEFAPAKAPCCG
jgi:hypothetical protein